MERKSNFGLFLLICAAFFYASFGVFSKIIGDAFPTFTQTWTRSVIALLLFIAFCFYKKLFIKIQKEDLKWFFITGTVGALSLAPTFYAFVHLNIGTVLFIFYAITVITSYILGVFFLKEKLTKVSISAFFLAFCGLLFVFWGDIRFDFEKIIPVIAACASGIFFSIWFVFSKKISSKYPTPQINTFGYVLAVLINFFIALILNEPFNANFISVEWLANIGYGFAGFAGSGLTMYGFKYIEAHKGSLVLLLEIVFGALFGFLLFHEILNPTTIAGGLLIIFSILVPNVFEIFKIKPESTA